MCVFMCVCVRACNVLPVWLNVSCKCVCVYVCVCVQCAPSVAQFVL
jgi:hypothetical protein